MAILAGEGTRALIQGITGPTGRSFARRLIEGGTALVAGVTPGRGGEVVEGVPVFDSVMDAVAATGADAGLALLGITSLVDGILEAVEAGLGLLVAYAENVALHDAVTMVAYARARGARLLGPNSAGVISPGRFNLSDLNPLWVPAGRVGIVSKSGTLTYEAAAELGRAGMGASTIVCLGGDRVIGTVYSDVLPLFESDPETDAVLLIGEPGGRLELDALDAVRAMSKPVIAYFTGLGAPPAKRMGHAGAILGRDLATGPAAKARRYREAGCPVADLLPEIAPLVAAALAR